MNESEQAQAISEIKDALKAGVILYSDVSAYLKTTLKIVDSQAQKVAEQAKEIERLKKTEQQMCDAYDEIYGPVKSVADRKQYMAWMECARYLGVLPK